MEVAENSAVAQGDYVEPSYDFYNTKNLTSTTNCTSSETDEEKEENAKVNTILTLWG